MQNGVIILTVYKGKMYIIKGIDKSVEEFVRQVGKHGLMKDIKIQKLKDKDYEILSDLTNNQKKILNFAKKFGYYDYPRKITSEELAEKIGVDKDIVLENLRKAEKSIITKVLAEKQVKNDIIITLKIFQYMKNPIKVTY